jgi:hypothetical protein
VRLGWVLRGVCVRPQTPASPPRKRRGDAAATTTVHALFAAAAVDERAQFVAAVAEDAAVQPREVRAFSTGGRVGLSLTHTH